MSWSVRSEGHASWCKVGGLPLSEAKARLSRYGQLCRNEPVVTVNGKPSFQLVPLDEDDDLINRLLEHHPGFRRLLEERLGDPAVSLTQAEHRLGFRRKQAVKRYTR